MRLKRPKSCVASGSHRAEVRIWIDKGKIQHDYNLDPNIECYVTDMNWDQQWRRFKKGGYAICLCGRAAIEVGFVW